VDVPALPPDILGGGAATGEPSAPVRDRVLEARARQRARYAADGIRLNAELAPGLMAHYCGTDGAGRRILELAVHRLALSARAYDRVRKVARTIADLAGMEVIAADHLAEALQFRML
jgi:magnesium chelatase family protein